MEEWHSLSFAELLKELVKSKVKLTLAQKADLEDYFNAELNKAQTIKTQIDQTDKAIDGMVYQLYGIYKDEVEILK